MHKTNGNMSSQHRKENTGKMIMILPEEMSKDFNKLARKYEKNKGDVTKFTAEELYIWLHDCKVWEKWSKSGMARKRKRDWVKNRKSAEKELNTRLEKYLGAE
jgi:hypothetical protein